MILGPTGDPSTDPTIINASFPSTRPDWDYNIEQGKERLQVYCQDLLVGLKGAARKPTNMSKVFGVRQGPEESPAAYLE